MSGSASSLQKPTEWRVLDRLGIGLLTLLWLLSFGFATESVIRDTAYPPVSLDLPRDARDYPRVASVRRGAGAEPGPLRVGDLLRSADGSDLRGLDSFGWAALVSAHAGPDAALQVELSRADEIRAASVPLGSHRRFWPRLLASLVFAVCGGILLRTRPTSLTRALVVMNLATACVLACNFIGGSFATLLSYAAHVVGLGLGPPMMVVALLSLPWSPPKPPWAYYAAAVFGLFGIFDLSRYNDVPLPREIGGAGNAVLSALLALTVVSLLWRAYRRADPTGRRQLKWVLLGAYLATLIGSLGEALGILVPGSESVLTLVISGIAVFPLSILIAIYRFDFLDVDRVLSRTASLSLVVPLVAFGAIVSGGKLLDWVSERTAVDPSLSVATLTGVALMLIVALDARLRPRLDNLLFAEQRQMEDGLLRLVHDLAPINSFEQALRFAGEQICTFLKPERCLVYSRSGDSFVPLWHQSSDAAVSFARASALAVVLAEQKELLVGYLRRNRRSPNALSEFQWAVLETLGTAIVIPVRHDGELAAFIGVGRKRSRDIYTPRELALLELVADRLESEIDLEELSEVAASSQTLQHAFKRFVPGDVADRIEEGGVTDEGEKEVSVLFVDVRGFSGIADTLQPSEVFALVNAYTTAVSGIIERHGGTVVEFNGDGMMAVFGALRHLAAKEAAAVAAGRAILETVPGLEDTPTRLEVGVGVATGKAFVGSVRAADRMIWTALGRTTNLAARLQVLTRDFDAAMLIDAHTWEAAAPGQDGFERLDDVAIRGLQQRESLYLLPRQESAR